MKGYASFLIVLFSLLLALALCRLRLSSDDHDLSRAIIEERAYGVVMDQKEAFREAARSGAVSGFSSYDLSHDLGSCSHCPDHFCSPPLPGGPKTPNDCDAILCSACFRGDEAREAAVEGARMRAGLLRTHVFDQEFQSLVGPADFEAYLRADPAGKNLLALDRLRLKGPLSLGASSVKFGISASGGLPAGFVIRAEGSS
ncbi:MAG: hypothetical protein U0R44_05885 [Candidatus Micrarchaeia archaeon]